MTYFFETYGCQMNIAESASVEQLFIARGFTKALDVQIADVVVINTCSVRATAENRIFGRLGYFCGLKAVREKSPNAKTKSLEKAVEYVKDGARPLTLVVMGCMAERLLKTLQNDFPFIDYVVGTFAKKDFGKIISEIEKTANKSETQSNNFKLQLDDSPSYEFAPLSLEQGAFSSYVPIMHGCNNFCTYCIVPYVRGREISRAVPQILNEIDVLSSYGVKEITLLGQNVNSYLFDDGTHKIDFPLLLSTICNHLEKTSSPIMWVRFLSSHPKDLSDKLIEVITTQNRVCPHIHLPVQHGSTKILSKMNRKYTREDYLLLVQKIRDRIPNVSLTTDIMVGFPGETENDFEEVVSLMKEVQYENAFMYYYNPREGTPASKMQDAIPIETKKARLKKIIDMQLLITRNKMQSHIGEECKVLVESISRDNSKEVLAKTARDERVAFEGNKNLVGNFTEVTLTSLCGNTFKGQKVVQ